ncbi:hypothetical protein [Streptomyces humicola]|uniref:hypothetical protein n=1 Tax=Streptomyces humicola TaxID=2953240 RepID=UPI00210C34C7|nr:hypothetical protein [Streptomyces humicola]
MAAQPARSSPVEQGLAIGGWTLSLLPVHVAPRRAERPRTRAADPRLTVTADAAGAAAALPTPRTPRIPARARPLAGAATASRHRR